MNAMINDILIIMIIEWVMADNERVDRLLRPLNTLNGRDVIKFR